MAHLKHLKRLSEVPVQDTRGQVAGDERPRQKDISNVVAARMERQRMAFPGHGDELKMQEGGKRGQDTAQAFSLWRILKGHLLTSLGKPQEEQYFVLLEAGVEMSLVLDKMNLRCP